jgi:acetyl esterase/lipase
MPTSSPLVLEPAVQQVADAFFKPQGATGMLPVIVYIHGGGWILGNAGTHDRLVRELAVGAGAALAFVALSNTRATRAAIGQATAFLRAGLHPTAS